MKSVIKFILIGIVFMHSGFAAETILRFQPHINHQASRLKDVLLIENDIQHWSNLPLESHPKPGETITKSTLLDWLTLHVGHIDARWEGKTQAQVEQIQRSSRKALAEKARIALIERIGKQYSRVEVKLASEIHDSEYPLDQFTTDMHLTYPIAKRVCVWLVHEKKKIPVWFKVNAYMNVLTANRPIHANTPLQTEAFSLHERNVAGLNKAPAQTIPKNVWLKSSLTRHAVLLIDQIKSPSLITHGQRIKVLAHNGSVTVTMDATALMDGDLNDSISVKNPLNQNTFVVRVSGAQQAEIVS